MTDIQPGSFRFAIGKEKDSGLQDTEENSSTSGKDKHYSDQDDTSGNSNDRFPGGKVVAVWWRDRRDVMALSTMHNTSASVIMKRQKGCHEKRPISCPTIITDYNQYMGGVDLMDQHLSYYSMTTRLVMGDIPVHTILNDINTNDNEYHLLQ